MACPCPSPAGALSPATFDPCVFFPNSTSATQQVVATQEVRIEPHVLGNLVRPPIDSADPLHHVTVDRAGWLMGAGKRLWTPLASISLMSWPDGQESMRVASCIEARSRDRTGQHRPEPPDVPHGIHCHIASPCTPPYVSLGGPGGGGLTPPPTSPLSASEANLGFGRCIRRRETRPASAGPARRHVSSPYENAHAAQTLLARRVGWLRCIRMAWIVTQRRCLDLYLGR
jgi:hypothetical protein